MATFADFVACFASATDAADYESSCLSIDRTLLPDVARKVVDREDLSDAERSDYADWLIEQVSA